MLPDTTGTEVLELTSLLLCTSYSRLAVNITSKLIPQVSLHFCTEHGAANKVGIYYNMSPFRSHTNKVGVAWWPSGRASDSGGIGQGFDPHSGRLVVSLSKIHLAPKKYW